MKSHPIDIGAARLIAQRIAGAKFDTPQEVVQWMGALQAQDYGQAVWAVALRMKKPSLCAVEQAIRDRKILLTWPMRHTLHFVPAEDAKWIVEAIARPKAAPSPRRQEVLGITNALLDAVEALAVQSLKGGKRLTRIQLMELLKANKIAVDGQKGISYLSYLAQKGILCRGPLEAKQQTFVLLNEWVHAQTLERPAALIELARRYFTSHGPATIYDFANWTGLSLAEVKPALNAVKNSLDMIHWGEKEYWLAKETPAGIVAQNTFLLPGYDEFLLGYQDRSAVLPATKPGRSAAGDNGLAHPIIVQNGQVIGTWKRTIKRTAVEVSFAALPGHALSLASTKAAAEVYAKFIGLPLKTV